MASPPLTSVQEYWESCLAGAVGIELAPDWRSDPSLGPQLMEEELALDCGLPPIAEADRSGSGVPLVRFSLLLAAWYGILHRHTGQTDLLVGTRHSLPEGPAPAFARNQFAVLPLRTIINPSGSFAELAESVRSTIAGAFEHAPADAIVYGPIRVGFTLLSMIPADRRNTRLTPWFDIELVVRDTGPESALRLVYDASRFSRPTALRLLRHVARFVSEAQNAPQSPVRRLPVEDEPARPSRWPLSGPARRRLPSPDAPESLADRFRSVAGANPDRVAVSGPSGEYQYAELDRDSTALAVKLRRQFGGQQRFALLCDHDIGLALGIWSVLKAGATYVPVDPRQPDGRLGRIVDDAQVDAIVCDDGLVAKAASLARGKPVISLSDPFPEVGDPSLPPVTPGTVAYLLHTSGTTGGPKAVMQTHANVLAHALTYADRLGIGPDDRVPLLARFTFDLAVVDFFATLLTGASLHIIDPLTSAPELWDRIAQAGATMLHCTPTYFRHLMSGVPGVGEDSSDCAAATAIRAVVLGGEKVTNDDLQAFFARFPEQCALVSGLSSTECSVAIQHLSRRSDLAVSSIPVGYPVDGVRARLLDEDGLPTEVFGELEILSERVALGYWNRPDATAVAFGEHPDGIRFYRTGDLARRLPDGEIVHCGRKDRQVKIRGHRVEPAEVEGILRAHPTVAQAAVLYDQRPDSPRLVAYATSSTAVPLDIDELAGYLGRQLPDYAVPARILALDAMPVGPTGKLDHSRLPLPDADADADASFDEPEDSLERAVADIWCQVLGIPRIGTRITFMASGGDSILLMALMGRLREDLQVEIPLIDVLKNPTVAGMADLVRLGGPNH